MKQVALPVGSGLAADDPLLKRWLVAARLPFLTGSVLPVVAATAAVWWADGRLHRPVCALAAVVGVALIHLGANLANDYFDHRSGADEANRWVTPFSGGSRVIQEGILGAGAVRAGALVCLGAGAACGVGLWLTTGVHAVAIIGLVGVALAWCYTSPPLRLVHRGLGEPTIFVCFGLLPVLGAEAVQRGAVSLAVGWVGLPAGLLITAVLWVNEFPDVESDAAAGKRTLVVRLGTRRAAAAYGLLVGGAYVSVLVGVMAGWMPWAALVVLLTAPLSWRAVRLLRAHHAEPAAVVPSQAATIGQHAVFLTLLIGGYLAALGLRAWR